MWGGEKKDEVFDGALAGFVLSSRVRYLCCVSVY